MLLMREKQSKIQQQNMVEFSNFIEKIKSISGEYKEVNIVVSIQKDHGAEKYRIITIYPGKKGE